MAGLLEVFMEETAFEMRLKEWERSDMELLGEGHMGWREGINALGTGTGRYVQRILMVRWVQ